MLGVAALWVAIGTFSLIDLQFGHLLYFATSSHDIETHTAFTAALARYGIPPHNPFFFAGQPAPLRYHYFWFIPSGLVDLLGGSLVSARHCVIAGTIWAGLGLLAVIALYLRFFQHNGGEQIERRALIGVLLVGVTGLDILPVTMIDLLGHGILPSVEWWNPYSPVPSWIATVFWAPHDLASLVAGLAGFLLTWGATQQERWQRRIPGLVGGGLAFASSVGGSVYVGGTLAAGCALWLGILVVRRWWKDALVLAGAGVLALVFLWPFIHQVTHGMGVAKSATPSAFPFTLTVRRFEMADAVVKPRSTAGLMAVNAIFLPLNYFLEFGFFFVVGWIGVRRIWRKGFRDRAEMAAAALGLAALLIGSFMGSTLIAYNDLGCRSMLIVQFILLIWAAEMLYDGTLGFGSGGEEAVVRTSTGRRWIVALLVLGALGSCYELCFERIYPILSDRYNVMRYVWLAEDHQLGRRTFALRSAYEELNRMLPASAVVQAAPDPTIGNLPAELYSGRQMVADVGDCGTTFGGSTEFCNKVILPQLDPIFDGKRPVTEAEADQVCREFGITALLFKDTDPVWKDKSSWIWKAQPMISNDYVRVIRCDGVTDK